MVIRLGQLVSYIKDLEEKDDIYKSSEAEMRELIDCFMQHGSPNRSDYAKKYEELVAEQNVAASQDDKRSMPSELHKNAQAKNAIEKNISQDSGKKCPRCGASLVLRTSKKGGNIGKQFWGCSAFPKCWFKDGNI